MRPSTVRLALTFLTVVIAASASPPHPQVAPAAATAMALGTASTTPPSLTRPTAAAPSPLATPPTSTVSPLLATQPTSAPSPPSAPGGTASSDAPGDQARWGPPVEGHVRVLRHFAPPARPWLAGHRGTDLAVRLGQRVRAVGPGIVGYAGPFAGRGVVMIVHPNGLRTTYLPVHAKVRRGQRVTFGQTIGTVEASTSHCTSPCLHWGLIDKWRYLDPLLLVAHGQVRLLPHWPADTPARP
ncbi:peptidoglycan DD-metalloendopeptidase family protein [Sphaerisporangium sp. NPDC005288]|uniref:M23 family metallopeptidase n=1 Tax=Sphaerisporangium sp. NPDC005288 TaxID=3155114 RepID=UPI0033B9DA4E